MSATAARALSISAAARALATGPARGAVVLGHGHVLVGDGVLSITAPGAARMPNGVESGLTFARGERIIVGDGRIGPIAIDARVPAWDAVPCPRVTLRVGGDAAIDLARLPGRGPGLTPAGDDVLGGYAAGLVLFHGQRAIAHELAETAAARTTALSATLLRHAARGELPEPAHALLEHGDVGPLLAWGRTSGRCLALGLALAFGDPRHRRVIGLGGREVGTADRAAA